MLNIRRPGYQVFLKFIFDDLTSKMRTSHRDEVVEVLGVLSHLILNIDNALVVQSLRDTFVQAMGSNTDIKVDSDWECARLTLSIEANIVPQHYTQYNFALADNYLGCLCDYLDYEGTLAENEGQGERHWSFANGILALSHLGPPIQTSHEAPVHERILSSICLALEYKQSFALFSAGIRACSAVFWWNHDPSTDKLSSNLGRCWNALPDELCRVHAKEYLEALRSLPPTQRSYLLIRDHSQATKEICHYYAHEFWVGGMLENLFDSDESDFLSLVHQPEYRGSVIAWLRLAWSYFPKSYRIGDFTADLIQEVDSAVMDMLDIFPMFVSWACLPVNALRKEKYADVGEFWLRQLWKEPTSVWYQDKSKELTLTTVLDSTLVWFYGKGPQEMDEKTFHACLQFLWVHCDEVDEEVRKATTEVFKTGGEPTMNQYRNLLRSVGLVLQDEITSIRLGLDTDHDESQSRYKELCERRKRKAHVEEVLEKVFQNR